MNGSQDDEDFGPKFEGVVVGYASQKEEFIEDDDHFSNVSSDIDSSFDVLSSNFDVASIDVDYSYIEENEGKQVVIETMIEHILDINFEFQDVFDDYLQD